MEGVSGFNLCRRISNSWLDVSVSQCVVSLTLLRTNGVFSSAKRQLAFSPSFKTGISPNIPQIPVFKYLKIFLFISFFSSLDVFFMINFFHGGEQLYLRSPFEQFIKIKQKMV